MNQIVLKDRFENGNVRIFNLVTFPTKAGGYGEALTSSVERRRQPRVSQEEFDRLVELEKLAKKAIKSFAAAKAMTREELYDSEV